MCLTFFGGEYRNRIGVHGFAKLRMIQKTLTFLFRRLSEFFGT